MAGQSFFQLHPFYSEAMFTSQRFCQQPSGTVTMAALNPYTVKASEVLDREIHEHIHGESSEGSPPPYSSSDREAERLRRRPAKPMGSPRMGSNPTGVDAFM